jgi:putative endonuclease
LLDQGLRPVARNFQCRGGEIDLIMMDGRCLTFVEVRFRRSSSFTAPGPTVDRRKQRKLVRTAAMFTSRNPHLARAEMRFDVIAVDGSDGNAICWYRDAFRPHDSTL